MAELQQHTQVNSLDELVALVPAGESLFLTVPHSRLSGRLNELVLRSLNRAEQKTHLVTFAPEVRLLPAARPTSITSLAGAKSAESALTSLKTQLAKSGKNVTIVFDFLSPYPAWAGSDEKRTKFIVGAFALPTKARRIWAVPSAFVPDQAWVGLKDKSGFFLSVIPVGLSYYGQFLKAQGIYSAEFFLPRRLVLSENFLNFDRPSIPSIESPPVPAELGAQPPGLFEVVDLLDLSYRKIFESSPDGLILFDLKGRYRESNQRAAEMLGYTQEELKSVSVSQICPTGQVRRLLRAAVTLRRKGKIVEDVELVRKSGRPLYVSVAAALVDRGRYVAMVRETGEKVKEVAKLRETAKYYQDLFTESIHPQAIVANRKIVEANRAFRDAFGLPESEPIEGRSLLELWGKPNAEFLRELFATDVGEGGETLRRDILVKPRESTEKRFEVAALPLPSNGTRAYYVALTDISARIDALHVVEESEKRFRTLVESAAGAVSVVRDGKFSFVNYGFLQLFGYSSPAEMVGQDITITVPKREREHLLENSEPANALGVPPAVFQYAGVRKDGQPLQIEATTETIVYGGSHALLCYHRDVSKQKAFDEQVRKRAHIHQILDHVVESLAQVTTAQDVLKTGLEASIKWLGYETGGVLVISGDGNEYLLASQIGLPAKIAETLKSQPTTEGLTGFAAKTLEPAVLSIAEYPPFLPYRALFESEGIEAVMLIPLVAGETAPGVLVLTAVKRTAGQIRDVEILASVGKQFGASLERARQFDMLINSERQYQSAVEGVQDIIYQTHPNGSFVYVSPRMEALFGYRPEEFLRNGDVWRSAVHPDDRSTYSRRISGQSEATDSLELEYRFMPKGKASYKWVRDAVRYSRDATGQVQSVQGTVSDITRQVEAARKAGSLEDLNRGVLNAMDQPAVLYDTNGVCTGWNRALEALTGRMAIQTLGERLSDGATPIDPLAMEEALRKALSNEIATSEGVLQSEEAQKALSVRFTPVIDRQGTVVAALGVLAEATPGQANNQDTTESEAALREVINTMGDALVISDLQGRVREVNREFTHLTGYGRSEAQGTEFPYPWLLEEETPRFVQWISELREKRYLRDFDMTWRHKDGHETAISLSTTLFRNASGEPVAMLNIARDIGERRRLVTELATRSRQIEMLNRIISRANSTVDFAEIFETVSAEVGKILAFDEINVALLSEDRKSISIIARAGENIPSVHMGKMVPLDRTVSQLAVQRGEAVVVSNLPKHPELGTRVYSVQEGLKSQISIPIVLNNRILGTLNVASLEPEKFSDADLKILQPISDQIGAMIDRARLFQKVSDDSKYIHNLLNSIDSVVFTVDESYHVREVNHAWRQYAALKGFNQQTDESAAVGMNLESVIADPALWAELNQSMPKLFDGTMKIFSTEVVLGRDPWDRTFRLVVNPMTIGGKVIGLVFTYTDLTEIVRTKEEVNRRNEELVALNAISASITKTLNLEEVLDVAFTQVREMLKADTFLCFLEYGERGKLALARSFGIDTGTASGIQNLEIGKGSEALASAHEPFMVALGTSHDGDLVSALRALLGCIGKDEIIVLPLQSKERALGALLMTLPGGHARFEEQRRFLSLLGSQLGSAIENAQLYAEVQAQVQRITSLYELGRGLTGALDSKTLLELVHGEVSRSIPLRTFTYDEFLERPFALKAVFRALHNDTGEYIVEPVTDERVVEDGSPAKGVLTTGDPYLQTEGGLEPVMIVPVRSQQKVTGLITVTGAPGTVYTPTYLRLLESIANLTEIALDRVLLYEETIAKSREIEQRNRELDDFAYVVSHDLKEPLITIEGYSKIILGDHGDKLPDEGREHLASVVQSSGRMKNLIEDLLTLSRVGRSAEAPEFVSVKALLDDVLRDFVFTLEQRNAAVEIPERLPEVRYNATQLSMVFRNLISNAIKFNAQHRPQVTIGLKEKPDHFLFSVKDNGIGIAPEHYEKVFVIFQRLNRAEEYQGTGAGLTIVKRIIERHGGRIWVDSTVGEGTTFYFTVPR